MPVTTTKKTPTIFMPVILLVWISLWPAPAEAKGRFFFEDNIEITYEQGTAQLGQTRQDKTYIHVNGVAIYEANQQIARLDKLILRADGSLDEMRFIHEFSITQFATTTTLSDGNPLNIKLGFFEMRDLPIETLSNSFYTNVAQKISTPTSITLHDLVMQDHEFIMKLYRFDGEAYLHPLPFAALPQKAQTVMNIGGLRIIPLTMPELKEIGFEELNINASMRILSEKQGQKLRNAARLDLELTDLARLDITTKAEMPAQDYNEIIQTPLNEEQDEFTQQRQFALMLKALQSVQISLSDKGMLALYQHHAQNSALPSLTTIIDLLGFFGHNVNSEYEWQLIQALTSFFDRGGRLTLSADIDPPLSLHEIYQAETQPYQFLERINFKISHQR